jgi:hypothetical protein
LVVVGLEEVPEELPEGFVFEAPDVLVFVLLLLEEAEEGLCVGVILDAAGVVVVVVEDDAGGVVAPVSVVVAEVFGVVCAAAEADAGLDVVAVAGVLPVVAGVWAEVVPDGVTSSPLNAAASEAVGRLATGTAGISGWAGDWGFAASDTRSCRGRKVSMPEFWMR